MKSSMERGPSGPGKLKKAIVGAMMLGGAMTQMPGEAAAREMKVEGAKVDVQTTKSTEWAAQIIKEAEGDIEKLKTQTDAERWIAFVNDLTSGYSEKLDQSLSREDYEAFSGLAKEMARLMGTVERKFNVKFPRGQGDSLKRMLESARVRAAAAGIGHDPLARK